MLVKDLMKTRVLTVEPDDLIDRIFFLIHYEKVRHIPVVEKNRVVGIVSDRDLYKALGPRSRSRSIDTVEGNGAVLRVVPRKARQIMRRGVVTVGPDYPVAEAAAMMGRKKIGALPVVVEGELVGIITATDVLLAFPKGEEQSGKPS
jgi:acetoin utilization protein AcuB